MPSAQPPCLLSAFSETALARWRARHVCLGVRTTSLTVNAAPRPLRRRELTSPSPCPGWVFDSLGDEGVFTRARCPLSVCSPCRLCRRGRLPALMLVAEGTAPPPLACGQPPQPEQVRSSEELPGSRSGGPSDPGRPEPWRCQTVPFPVGRCLRGGDGGSGRPPRQAVCSPQRLRGVPWHGPGACWPGEEPWRRARGPSVTAPPATHSLGTSPRASEPSSPRWSGGLRGPVGDAHLACSMVATLSFI